MSTQNSLELGFHEYRGVTIKPSLHETWTFRQIFAGAPQNLFYSCYANSLEHAENIISNLLDEWGFVAVDGDLIQKEI